MQEVLVAGWVERGHQDWWPNKCLLTLCKQNFVSSNMAFGKIPIITEHETKHKIIIQLASNIFGEIETLVDFPPFLQREITFVIFCLLFPYTKPLWKELLLKSKFCPFRVNPKCQEGEKNYWWHWLP